MGTALVAVLPEPAASVRLGHPVTILPPPDFALRTPLAISKWSALQAGIITCQQERGRSASPLPQGQNQVSPSFRTA